MFHILPYQKKLWGMKFVAQISYPTTFFDTLPFIDDFQCAGGDVNHQAMHRDFREEGAIANHFDDLAYIEVEIVEDTKPAHQPLHIAQPFLLYQTVWIDSQRLHRSGELDRVSMREAALRVTDHSHLADIQQVD